MTEKILETQRLIMRPFKSTDAKRYFELTRDDDVKSYVPNACPISLEDTYEIIERYYSKGDWYHDFYIVLENKETHDIVGALIVYEDLNARYDMSILIGREYRRKGYMSEALNAFRTLVKGRNLIFTIKNNNLPSINTVKKLENVIEITEQYNQKVVEGLRIFAVEA